METKQAEFSQSRNDMHWSHYDLDDGFIRWSGYDDDFWWKNISIKDDWRQRKGEKSGKTYYLNPETCQVQIGNQNV